MVLEPKTLRRVFKGLLVVLSAAEIVWLYSILIFLILNIISFQVKRWSTSQDELLDLIWWVAQLVSIIILRVATAYYAYFRSHFPSFILIWVFDGVLILLVLILMPDVSGGGGTSSGALNTGIMVLTRFTLEILLSVFLVFLQVSDTANDDVNLLNAEMHPMGRPHPALVVRRVFVHRI